MRDETKADLFAVTVFLLVVLVGALCFTPALETAVEFGCREQEP